MPVKGKRDKSPKRLSARSSAIDRGSKGYLDPVEQKVREYDSDDDGQYSTDEVFKIVEDLKTEERKKNNLKKWLLFAILVGFILLISVFGLMWATIVLTRQVVVEGDALVDAHSKHVIATNSKGVNLMLNPADTEAERRLQVSDGANLIGRYLKSAFLTAWATADGSATKVLTLDITDKDDPTHFLTLTLSLDEHEELPIPAKGITRYWGLYEAGHIQEDNVDEFKELYHIDCPDGGGSSKTCRFYKTVFPLLGIVGGITTSTAVVGFQSLREDTVVQVKYSKDKTFSTGVMTSSESVTTAEASDYTGKITLTGLDPATTYYYRYVMDGVDFKTGFEQRFKTFPTPFDAASGAVDSGMTFTLFADMSQDDEEAMPFEQAAADSLFAMAVGDFTHANPKSLDRSRDMYKGIRNTNTKAGAPLVKKFLSKMGFVYTWDE